MVKMKEITDKYLLNRTVFKILAVVAMMITAVPYLHYAVGGYVKLLLGYGYLVLVYEAVTKKLFPVFKDKLNWILVLFCGSYFVTVFLNRDLNFVANFKALAYMVVLFALLFMTRPDKSKKSLIKECELITAVVIASTYILSFATFMTYMFSLNGSYTVGNVTYSYGFYDNRLWGIYNANTGSTLNALSILLSLGFIGAYPKKKSAVILNTLNILLQFICLVLTGSRASLYALLAVLAVWAFAFGLRRCIVKARKIDFKAILCGCLATALTVTVMMGSIPIIKTGMSYLPGATANIVARVSAPSDDTSEEKTPITPVDFTRMEEVENREGGFFNGRIDIWKASVSAFKESPVFGVGRENVFEKASPYLEGNSWKNSLKIGGTHNIYVCILLSSGLAGFLLMLVFAAYTFIKSVAALLKNFKKPSLNIWLAVSLLIVAVFYVTEFVESRILYQMGIFNVLFWLYCGYMYAFAKKTAEDDEVN